jgi:ketosteroid isomerase-like protein
MKYSLSAVLATGLFSLAACSKAPEAVNIQALNQQFISAWNNKDEGKITAFLADDVQFIQGDSHLKGKSEVSQKWVRETLPSLSDLKTSVASSETDEHTAYEAGTFSVDVLPATPNEPHGYGEGNYILLWKKGQDNTWKLSYAQLEDLPVQRKTM